jgi:hypothetical protein
VGVRSWIVGLWTVDASDMTADNRQAEISAEWRIRKDLGSLRWNGGQPRRVEAIIGAFQEGI